MDTTQYLERITYAGTVHVSVDVLAQLQHLHLLHVPFENLDIHTGTKIDLTPAHLFHKIVIRKRGGFCYELNGLFYKLLKEIGFAVKRVSARVYTGEDYGPEFDHMALIVSIHNDSYLVDVGFGDFSWYPLTIQYNTEINDPSGIFRMKRLNETDTIVEKKKADGAFIPEYIFSEQERQVEEFQEMCTYHQTSPASHFTQKRICSLLTPTGRITFAGNALKITEKDKVQATPVPEQEVPQALWKYFGIKLS